jgi:G-rich domain on putative tyrosine kinase
LEAAKKGSARSAGSWLGKTIESLRERVAAADAKVEIYRSQNGLFLVGDATSISSQQLSELNTQLATARSAQTDLSSKARLIREAIRQGKTFEVSEVVNNELVRRLIESRATLRAQLAQEERTLLPQHPRIRELYAQLAGLEDQIRAAAERAARAFENDAKAAGARVAASQADLDLQKRQSGSANEQEVQLRALEREAKAEREQLETYLTRYRDASVRDADNAVAADARIVSRALVPSNPTFPKKLPVIIIATLSGFALSLFWILMKALLSDKVYARRAPEVAQQPMMGMYPPNMYPPNMYSPQMMAAMYANLHAGSQSSVATPQHVSADVAQPAPAHQAVMMASHSTQPPVMPSHLSQPVSEIDHNHIQAATVFERVVEAPARQPESLSAASVIMRDSLDRMSEALNANNPFVRTELSRHVIKDVTLQSDAVAPVIATPSVLSSAIRFEAPVSNLPPLSMSAPSMASADVYDPLMEVGEEASAALVRGRPVSVLVLSVHSADHAQGVGRSLEHILATYGPTLVASLDPDHITPSDLIQAAKGLANSHDYVVFNGGLVTQKSSALSRSTTLTVLVASEDLEDPRVDQASHALRGCNYFIVSASTARVKERI